MFYKFCMKVYNIVFDVIQIWPKVLTCITTEKPWRKWRKKLTEVKACTQITAQVYDTDKRSLFLCNEEIVELLQNKSCQQYSSHVWYKPLLSGYCWRKCLYRAVVVFFIKCLWCDLHFASALQTYFFPPLGCWTYKCIPRPLKCRINRSFLLGLGIRFSLQWLLTSFNTIIPPSNKTIL